MAMNSRHSGSPVHFSVPPTMGLRISAYAIPTATEESDESKVQFDLMIF
jgi:hypothetical protein